MIDIRNFVNVNIKSLEETREEGSRPWVLVYSSGETNDFTAVGFNSTYDKFYGEDGKEIEGLEDDTMTRLAIFFKNGGSKITFKTDALPTLEKFKNKNLIDNVIIVNLGDVSTFKEEDMDALGIYKKMIVEKAMTKTEYDTLTIEKSSYQVITISNKVGTEMIVASYLSQIKVYESCPDFNFTNVVGLEEDLSDEITYGTEGEPLTDLPYNFEMLIGNNYLTIGGNATDGTPFVTTFVSIILTQTTTNAVFNVLKLKLSGNSGINKIRTALCEELNKYTNSGYLTTDEIWGYQDLVVKNQVNDNSEVVITTNTPISNGYYIHIFKTSKNKQEVYIFLILATNKGIRYVKIDGRIM